MGGADTDQGYGMAYCFYQQAGIVVCELLLVFTHDDWIGIQYRLVEHLMVTIVELDGRLSGALADDEMATSERLRKVMGSCFM